MKKQKQVAEPKNGAIMICNILMAVVCVVSVITLYLGSFWNFEASVTIDKTLIETILAAGESGTGGSIKAEGTTPEDVDFLSYIGDDFSVTFPISIKLEGKSLVNSALGKDGNEINTMLSEQVKTLVDGLSDQVDVIAESAVQLVVSDAVEMVKEEIKKSLSEDAGNTEVMSALADKGITEEDINTIADEIGESIPALLDGDTASMRALLAGGSEELDKLFAIYAEEVVNADESIPPAAKEAAIAEQKAAIQKEVLDSYDEAIQEFSDEDGNFSTESLIVSVVNSTLDEGTAEAGIGGGASTTPKMTSMDEVKTYVSDKIYATIGTDVLNQIATYMGYVGYFLLFVMATWAYLLIKIVIKLFCKNKTVSMAIPRIWGWMPHVFLVGLPMLLVKYLPVALTQVEMTAEELTMVKTFLNAISLNFSSWTWISAAGTAVLMVLSFFYRGLRKDAKAYARSK